MQHIIKAVRRHRHRQHRITQKYKKYEKGTLLRLTVPACVQSWAFLLLSPPSLAWLGCASSCTGITHMYDIARTQLDWLAWLPGWLTGCKARLVVVL